MILIMMSLKMLKTLVKQERTDNTFPMDMPYIAEMQEKDKRLMMEIKKDNHK
jgi:hypothetical protein